MDWRELGFKTKPKNQLTCGGCYAFSVATSIEAQIFRRTGKVVDLSPQQIIDCSVGKGNTGCHGGSLRATLKFLDTTRGLMRESDYSYASEVTLISSTNAQKFHKMSSIRKLFSSLKHAIDRLKKCDEIF